ncbi:unnamed protein product [Knipowitschia caucasica]
MATADVIYNQSVVERVVSLPLVSSTYGLVSSVYSTTKDNHPYLKTVCEVAEQGVRSITSVALNTASPILDKLEPQIAIANGLACKGLDRIEKTLPILHQPSEQIVSTAKDAVTSAKDVVTGTVSGAKDSVSDTLNTVVERTRGAVHDGMEKTKAVVNDSVSTVLESRMARLVTSGVDQALSTSENLVEQYLPLTADELELEDKTVEGFDKNDPSYYVRLGSVSTKLRKRVYTRAVARILDGKQRSLEFISALNSTVDVVIESRTLTMARSLTHQLQTTCQGLASGLQGLPSHIQQEALSLSHSASQVYSSFNKAQALGDLSDGVLSNSRVQLGKMKDSLDNVMDYLVNNTPLNWLVGPFYPRMAPEYDGASNSGSSPQVEMEPLQSKHH